MQTQTAVNFIEKYGIHRLRQFQKDLDLKRSLKEIGTYLQLSAPAVLQKRNSLFEIKHFLRPEISDFLKIYLLSQESQLNFQKETHRELIGSSKNLVRLEEEVWSLWDQSLIVKS